MTVAKSFSIGGEITFTYLWGNYEVKLINICEAHTVLLSAIEKSRHKYLDTTFSHPFDLYKNCSSVEIKGLIFLFATCFMSQLFHEEKT